MGEKVNYEKVLENIQLLINGIGIIPKSLEIVKLKIVSDTKELTKYVKNLGYAEWADYYREKGYRKEQDIKVGNKYKSQRSINLDDLKIIFSEFYKIHNRYPTSEDLNVSFNEMPTYSKVLNILKNNNTSWAEFLLKEYDIFIADINKYNEYIDKLKEICDNLKRPLKYSEFLHNDYQLPDSRWFVNHCPDKNVKNYNQFLEYLGYKPRKNMSKELATKKVLELQHKLNRPLIIDDFQNINRDDDIGISTINNHWGSFNKMKEELGLEIIQECMTTKHKPKEEMVDDMNTFINQLGRLPSAKEINENKDMNSAGTYCRFFGGINNVFLSLGYIPKKKDISQHLSNDDIIKIYQDFVNDLEITPTYQYCKKIYELPSPKTVLRRLECSWNEFMEMLGCNPNTNYTRGHTCKAKDGTICLSISECIIHNYLIVNNINIIAKEYYYKNLVEDNEMLKEFIGYKRFDWLLQKDNKFYIVEYFGLMGHYDYNKRHDLKLEFINKLNLQDYFIAIYPKDLNKLDEIFSFLK